MRGFLFVGAAKPPVVQAWPPGRAVRIRPPLPRPPPPFPPPSQLAALSPDRFRVSGLASSAAAETGTEGARSRSQNRVRMAPRTLNRTPDLRRNRYALGAGQGTAVRRNRYGSAGFGVRFLIRVPFAYAETGTGRGFFRSDAEMGTDARMRPPVVRRGPDPAETGTQGGAPPMPSDAQKWVRLPGGRSATSAASAGLRAQKRVRWSGRRRLSIEPGLRVPAFDMAYVYVAHRRARGLPATGASRRNGYVGRSLVDLFSTQK